MRFSKQGITVTTMTAITGIRVRESTYNPLHVSQVHRVDEKRGCFPQTFWIYWWNGKPWSLANDQVIRLAVAAKPMTAHHIIMITIAVITVAPALPVPL